MAGFFLALPIASFVTLLLLLTGNVAPGALAGLTLSAIAGALLALHGRQRPWIRTDHRYCGACGYDLTGVRPFPTTRCPECGQDYASAGVQTFFQPPTARTLCIAGCGLQLLPVLYLLLCLTRWLH